MEPTKQIEKGFNLRVVEAKKSILKAMVDCRLPATVLQLIISDLSKGIDAETNNIVKKEIEDFTRIIDIPSNQKTEIDV